MCQTVNYVLQLIVCAIEDALQAERGDAAP